LRLTVGYWYNNEEEQKRGEKAIKTSRQCFKDRAGHNLYKYDASYTNYCLFGKYHNKVLDEDNAFADWIIEQGDKAIDKFIEILGYFIAIAPIQETMTSLEKTLREFNK